MSNKKFGLILSEKGKRPPVFEASRNVFGNDSDSEEERNKRPLLLQPSDITNRQSKITQEKAIVEDPTVYQYDEIYEDMSRKKETEKLKTKEEKKPKYIENLLKAASKRKIENERRVERQIQKEREKEGDEFKDKEVFVTSAYKKKLEDMRLEEEKEKREEYLESIGDVTKQNDLGGFYRHLYEQKLGKDKPEEISVEDQKPKNISKDSSIEKTEIVQIPKPRNYRKRKSSDQKKKLSEGELEDSDEEINHLNLRDISMAKKSRPSEENIDADSDFSIDESSDDETDKKKGEELNKTGSENQDIDKTPERTEVKKTKVEVKNIEVENKKDIITKPKEKIDVWKKRTVGVVLEEALKRYYERKAARGS